MPQDDPEVPATSGTTEEEGWTFIDLITASKVDINGLENDIPVSLGNGFYLVSFDATTVYLDVNDMLSYVVEIPDTDLSESYTLQVALWFKAESDTRLVGGAFACNASSALGNSLGYWVGLSEQTVDDPDFWIRQMGFAVPSASSQNSERPMFLMTYQHCPNQDQGSASLYEVDENNQNPVYQRFVSSSNITSPATTGSMFAGALLSARTIKGQETATIRVGIRKIPFPV